MDWQVEAGTSCQWYSVYVAMPFLKDPATNAGRFWPKLQVLAQTALHPRGAGPPLLPAPTSCYIDGSVVVTGLLAAVRPAPGFRCWGFSAWLTWTLLCNHRFLIKSWGTEWHCCNLHWRPAYFIPCSLHRAAPEVLPNMHMTITPCLKLSHWGQTWSPIMLWKHSSAP